MKSVVMREPGGPEVLRLEERPVPVPRPSEVLIRVRAFGLNRSEMFTRQGHSPDVVLPRVLGIEAVGEVEQAPGGEFARGAKVATCMGGMGRSFDGGYSQYVCVPARQVLAVETSLPWDKFGALPEMMQTAWGSLFRALKATRGERILIRGGSTSIGLAAAALAKREGAMVTSTTRSADRYALLRRNGADEVLIDDGHIADQVRNAAGGVFDKVLELIGVKTLADSLLCAKEGGLVCMTGLAGNAWSMPEFDPMALIPVAVRLTTYGGGPADLLRTPLKALADEVAAGTLPVEIGRVFRIDQIVEAHRCMEANEASGKIVILTD